MGISFLWVLILVSVSYFFPKDLATIAVMVMSKKQRKLSKLYGVLENHRVVVEELAEIKQAFDDNILNKDQKWDDVFTAPRMAYRIALCVALQALEQLTGAN
jgi:SP family sugar:H+ symporter-like MFS transporter